MKKTLAAYVVIGLAVFAPILRAWFVADDWDFLILVATAKSAGICFVPLVGRFVRPLMMATYYVNYHSFGLRPFSYHLTIVVLHSINAWLVCLLAQRLGLSRLVALGAGLIFLVFAGHSEAVSWVAGAADPWLIVLLAPALLLFDHALTAERSAMPIAGVAALLALCLLAKETGVIGPALLLAFGASRLLLPLDAIDRRRTMVRTLTVVAIAGVTAVAYLAVRSRIFGSVFGAYSQLGTSRGFMLAESRAFLLRAFLPPGSTLAGLWTHSYDIVGIAAVGVWLTIVYIRRPETRRALAFLLPALAIGLAPALPLTISLANTVSERYVYVATVFSSILSAWFAELLFGRRRTMAATAIVVCAAFHVYALERANRRWVAAGGLARTVTGELIDRVRAADLSTRTLVMNVPDTAAGVFVVRGAFYNSFHLMAPGVAFPERRLAMIATTAAPSPTEHTSVERTGPRSFTVTPDRGVFLEAGGAPTPEYTFERWDPRGYAITFKTRPRKVQVLYTSDGHVQTAAVLPGVPVGWLDLPSGDAVCTGDTLRFSGWAVYEQPGVDVAIERADQPPGSTPLGTATWKRDSRPDVTGAFRDLPDADRAEWNYLLPCSLVQTAGRHLAVRVFAAGKDGARTDLGTRTVALR